MTYTKILVLLAVVNISVFAQNTTYSSKTIKLNKTGQTSLAILSKNQIIVGYEGGRLQIIDIESKKVNKTLHHFQNTIRSIQVLGQNKIFVHDDGKVLMLDNNGKMLRLWEPKQLILGISVAENATGFGYIAVVMKKRVDQVSFSHISQANRYYTFFQTGKEGADFAAYSPLHTHLYMVKGRNQQLAVFHIANSTIFDPALINKTNNFTANAQNSTFKPNKTHNNQSNAKQQQGSKKQTFDKDKKKHPFEDKNMRNKYLQNSQMKNLILDRKFNFRIKQIIVDHKQPKKNNQGMIMVTEQDVVYHTVKGAISSFFPYKNNTQDELIAICFCQRKNLLILHRHLTQDKALFYLSFFNKKTLILEKVLQLNSIFHKLNEIKLLDCNSNVITLLTQDSNILILENLYEQQQIQSTEIEPKLVDQWQISQLQWALTIVLLVFFICCCRKKKNQIKVQPQNQQQADDQQQSGQIEESSQEKKQDQKKTSENSSEEESKSSKKEKSNKSTLFEGVQKQKTKKNKKKLN